MAYLALYRRFRPQGFEGLIGQEHIVKILKNQINTGKIGHAYLFCGARGTGKTTVAKVFARAINCLSPRDGSPCGECEVCRGLRDQSNMDILEMDAASNNGVDDIREMRDKIQYPPVVGKYKVYIVDEVHMLSPAAFNALLKTLEEPPHHAVFIFATTEVHKIPQTILSRCMRFDFKLISQTELSSLIKGIFKEIGKDFEDEAVDAIARAGEGSARDSLSIADMCSSYSEGKLTYSDVLEVLGATDKGKVLALTESIIDGDTGAALGVINELAMLGKNMGVLADDVASVLRDLTVCKTAKNASQILCLPANRFNDYLAVSQKCDAHRLIRLIDIFTALDNAFRYSTHPRIVLETAVVKACRPDKDYDQESLLARMAELERLVKSGACVTEKPTARVFDVKAAETVKAPEIAQKPAVKAEAPVQKEEVKAEVEEPKMPKSEDAQVLEKTERARSINEMYFSADDELPPPEDIGALPEFDMFSMAPPIKKEVKPQPAAPLAEPVPPAKLWGNVLRSLRSNGNAVLWTVCQDVIARVRDGVLTITVANASEYEMFTREDHQKTLTETIARFGDYKLVINRKDSNDDGSDEFEQDVEEMKNTFGRQIVKIIEED
ncbi:MAG: DNA polymerase III subunit gamma/tau [Clostridia bacterium]|nr:DNA polymerase III subunit gamma/tau [Clostridia bacterium]